MIRIMFVLVAGGSTFVANAVANVVARSSMTVKPSGVEILK